MRDVIAIACDGETLMATLDRAAGATGVLIVSGGNEVRAGAHRGMAMLAARLAARGLCVLRYDRRGIGDSTGENRGFAAAAPDLAAALAALRETGVTRVVGYGNCDAATLLAGAGALMGIDAVVLSNPWTGAEADDLPPAAAIRAGYAASLRDPAEWRRLLRGGVDLRKLARGVAKLLRPARAEVPPVVGAIERWGTRATVVLAAGDATALAFAAAARGSAIVPVMVDTASHSFARAGDIDAVERAILHAAG
ncbi:hydrolase 1, exosortase A system-associated [Sphingomonas corticis]|jgi:exosortase A-associated hydrolase 1|uniref:Hydrolase 1, exosortase A system-associated n=1 Tax=Sphingomonas corticis TaxID=2722791 RepID=A0ABX1CLS5_9SPHN|nr:hydrolase 1, exosortase A system-associated [Sphingomonas corticis]NJR78354.1 hydrolase 1, exosortase A system-associated [Sphingomonas corticis]